MKQHEEREWIWCSTCNGKVEKEEVCKNCYLRFPEREAPKMAKKQS